MEIIVRGHNLPGRWFRSAGVSLHNVQVALQVGEEPDGLVPGDAERAEWTTEVRVTPDGDSFDFAGPGVHGRRGERFLYLTWGDRGEEMTFAMFRRAKLMLGAIDPALVTEAMTSSRPLRASVDLTDAHGGPRCARVGPPDLTWAV